MHDLPGVGENLQDHLEVYVQHSSLQPVSMAPYFKMQNRPKVGLEWLLRKSGPGATNHFEAGGFARSNDEVGWPNLMYHFLPIAIRYDGTVPEGGGGHGYQVHVGPMYSDVRGTCKAVSPDPRKHPALRFNYLSTPNDRREWIEAIRVTRKILSQPAFAPYDGGELSPGKEVDTDEQILDWVARDAETALHPSCTCRMGDDDMAVTDPRSLRVHGLDGLRVVDAAVFPYVTNGNIYAPVMMVAEKAADLILGNALPAERTEWYRHKPAATARANRRCPRPPAELRLAEGHRFASMALRAFPVLYAKDVEPVAAFYSDLGFAEHARLPAREGRRQRSLGRVPEITARRKRDRSTPRVDESQLEDAGAGRAGRGRAEHEVAEAVGGELRAVAANRLQHVGMSADHGVGPGGQRERREAPLTAVLDSRALDSPVERGHHHVRTPACPPHAARDVSGRGLLSAGAVRSCEERRGQDVREAYERDLRRAARPPWARRPRPGSRRRRPPSFRGGAPA